MPGTALDRVIDQALAEDVGAGDVTTDAIVSAQLRGSATAPHLAAGSSGAVLMWNAWQNSPTQTNASAHVGTGAERAARASGGT